MKKYYLFFDTFRNRIIIGTLAIVMLSIFNIWFVYKEQKVSQAALAPAVFFIDNSLSQDCLTSTGNYDPAIRNCTGSETGYKAWRNPWTALSWVKSAQTAGTITTGGHTIYFRAGIYRNYLTSEVWPSGAASASNKIEAYQNEEVILSGARQKTVWEDMSDGIYRTALTGDNNGHEKNYRGVFEDGQALYGARYPEDYKTLLSSSSTTREFLIDCDLNSLSSEKIINSWVEVMSEYLWKKRAKILSYDSVSCKATFSTVHDTTDTATGFSENNFLDTKTDGSYKNGLPEIVTNYRLVDNMTLLDTPGEYLYQVTADANDTDYVYVLPISLDSPANHMWELTSRWRVLLFLNNTHHLELRKLNITGAASGITLAEGTATTGSHHLVFDDLHIYHNNGSGIYLSGYTNNIIIKNSLIENNDATGVTYYGPFSGDDPWDFNILNSTYYSVNSEIYNNQFLNNISCGTYVDWVDGLDIHDNYYEGNALFNLNSSLSVHGSSNVDIYDNHMYRNGGNGILLEGTSTYRDHHIDVYNNLIEEPAYLSPGWVTGVWFSDTDYSNLYDNVIHSPNGVALHVDAGVGNKVIYNQFLDIFENLPSTTYGAVLLENADMPAETTFGYAINNTIAHNIFAGDFKYGLKVYTDIDVADGSNVYDNKVVNNIFYSTNNSKVIPISLSYEVNHALNTYNNNIYYAPNASEVKFVYQALGVNTTSEYSFANYKTQSNQESNSLQTNPLFTNFASNNFNLQSNSPAIDSARTLTGINNTSYQGQGPDIGLLEYASGPTCGNYLQESGEQCDDGNTSNGDGCSSSCQIEVAPDNGGGGGGGQGGTPPPPVEVEPEVVCGNAIEEEGETCDDGNILNNDGCSYLCQTEEDVETPSTNQIEIPKLQGTLIKTQLDPRVYYINNNNERYYIPNFNTFASWFQNFNSLTVVTPQTLASYPYLGRLTVKPGNLVKFDQDNKVYAVEPTKTLRWISTGNIFQDFGYDFNKIIHLPSEDFQHYTIGEDITNSDVHPTGQLLKHGNFTPIFYIKDSIEYWIKDEATFLSLGFKWQDIITIPVRYWYTRVLDGLQFRLQDR
jgi:cysteine-rich repeat protein